MKLKTRSIGLAIAISIIMIFTSVPSVSSSFAEAESEIEKSASSQVMQNEYIVYSDSDISDLSFPDSVEDVIYADHHTALIVLDSSLDLASITSSLKLQCSDLKIQPNYMYSENTVNDKYYSNQWGLSNGNGYDINFDEAFNFLNMSPVTTHETIVAVIDTGFDFTHSDLSANVWINTGEIADNDTDDDDNGYKDDVYGYDFANKTPLSSRPFSSNEYGHGTHCAGTIAALTNNGIGISGIGSLSNKIAIMDLKVLKGTEGEGSTFNLIRAITYADKNGADICNLSMSSNYADTVLYKTMKESDMLFVCAAGNDGRNLSINSIYPASYSLSNIICVANMTSFGKLEKTSNYSSRSVDIAAPGTRIYSTMPASKYGYMSGTSMSAPFVSGAAALLHSYYYGITASEIRQLLIDSASYGSSFDGKVLSDGYLNLYSALTYYSSDRFLPDETAPVMTTSISESSTTYKQTLHVVVTDNSDTSPTLKYFRGIKYANYFKNGGGYKISLDSSGNGTKIMSIPGIYTLYASDASGNYVLKQVTCTADAVKTIRLNKTSKTINVGKTFTLKVTLSTQGTYGRKLTFTSSKKSVAVVSSKGKITAKKKGTAIITVKTDNGLTAKCKVKVK